MKIKVLFLFILVISITAIVHADLLSDAGSDQKARWETAVNNDYDGEYYKDLLTIYSTPVSRDPEVYSNFSTSFGCSKFDFDSSFSNLFSSEALSSSLTNLATSTMKAAPLLLLEYASPTLASLVRHFDSTSRTLLGLRYAQCEDIESAGSDMMDRLRKKSEKECLVSKSDMDINKAIAACKAQPDPFASLKDSKGLKLLEGGQINVVEDALSLMRIPDERKEFIRRVLPETTIVKDGVEEKQEKETPEEILDENKKEFYKELSILLQKYKLSRNVDKNDLKKFNINGVPFFKQHFKRLLALKPDQRELAVQLLAEEMSVAKTVADYLEVLRDVQATLSDPSKTEIEKDILKNKLEKTELLIRTLKAKRELTKQYAKTNETLLSFQDKETLDAIIYGDGAINSTLFEERQQSRAMDMLPDK